MCVDFSCKTAYISSRWVQKRQLSFKFGARLNRELWLAYDDFREKTRLDNGI